MKVSKLLIREAPLQALPTLIKAVGTSEAIILQQIHFESLRSKDGGWVERSTTDWHREVFWFWSHATVKRAFGDLRNRGLIATDLIADQDGRLVRVRVDHDALELLLEGSGQIDPTPSAQNDPTLRVKMTRPPTNKGTTETEEENSPPKPPAGATGSGTENDPDPVQLVFDAWRGSTGHLAAVLDIARRRVIEKGLKSHGLDDLVDAVRGWRHSPHHRGENERRTVYNELKLLLRDAAQIEKFRDLERQHTTTTSTCPTVVDQKLAERWDDVVVPELRRAVDESVFDIWLADLHPHRVDGEQLILAAPSELATWVQERFDEILEAVAGRPVRVEACNRSTSTEGRAAA